MQLSKHILTTSLGPRFAGTLIILVTIISSTAAAKSLYAITDHHASRLTVYDIQGNRLKYQAHTNVTKYATDATGLAIDSNLKLLFITYESSAIIVWVNAETLAQEGFITIPTASNLAGIVADEAKQRVYAVERDSNRLYICAWDADKQELVLVDPPYITLTNLDNNGAWGLALDKTKARLYVGNNTTTVHFYDTKDWMHLGMRNVGRPMADVAVDPNNGQHNAYLYIGALYRRAGQGHYFLVKHDLEAPSENACNIESEIGTVPIGLAVSPASSLVYTTTSDQQVRVYDCSRTPFICTYSENTGGISAGAGICVPTKDVSYKWPLALSKTDNTAHNDCASIGEYVTYTISYGNPITNLRDPNYVGDVKSVVIIDYLPLGTDFDSASDDGIYDANLHTVTWDIGMLSPGDRGSVKVTVKINENIEQGSAIINSCEIEGESTHNMATVRTSICRWCSWNPSPADEATGVKQTPTLRWSPGDKAAQHDLYLGTDEAKVSNADTTTAGIYRGQQTATSFAPGELQWSQTYYWRVDEVNNLEPQSPWKGNVWSFTTADYIIVDDFEDYNDYSNRIFQTWIDGFGYTDPSPGHPGNGTGSTVGYVDPPFTEQIIVHEGKQSMPFYYNNVSWPYYSMTERIWDVPQDWTRDAVIALTLWFRGLPRSVGSFGFDEATGICTITADGSGIAGQSDQFHYVYKRLSGTAVFVAKVLSVSNTHNWAKAGVMIRDALTPDSAFAAMVVTPENGCGFQARFTKGGYSDFGGLTDQKMSIKAPCWVSLTSSLVARRSGHGSRATGHVLEAYYSSDPATDPWHSMEWNPQIIVMPSDVYIGLVLTSHNSNKVCVFNFVARRSSLVARVTGHGRRVTYLWSKILLASLK